MIIRIVILGWGSEQFKHWSNVSICTACDQGNPAIHRQCSPQVRIISALWLNHGQLLQLGLVTSERSLHCAQVIHEELRDKAGKSLPNRS